MSKQKEIIDKSLKMSEIKKGDFAKWIFLMSTPNSDESNVDTKVSIGELANRLNVSVATFKKRLYKTRPTHSRDYIIAICSQLHMNIEQTNKALFLYDMPILNNGEENELNSSYCLRDKKIVDILEKGYRCRMSICDINNELIKFGFKPLYIPDSKQSIDKISEYSIMNINTKVNIDSSYYNRYDSLISEYSFDMYSAISSLIIKNDDSGCIFKLSMSSDGKRYIYNHNEDGVFLPIECNLNKKIINNFEDYFSVLENVNQKELHKIYLQIDDTKNYHKRITAKYIDGKIHIFAEIFNTFIPELNEYCFIDYCNGQFEFSMSNKSQFLYHKIGEIEYKKEFTSYNPQIMFKAFDETMIAKEYRKYHNFHSEKMVAKCVDLFCHLKKMVIDLKEKIKKREVFICNIESIFEGPNMEYDICWYMKANDLFDFELNNQNCCDIYTSNKKEEKVIYKGNEINITIEDIKISAELGLNCLEEVCELLLISDSISNILNNL